MSSSYIFLIEPFIVPQLYEKYQTGPIQAIDEWTLSMAMRADTSPGGGISQIELHYQTFIVGYTLLFSPWKSSDTSFPKDRTRFCKYRWCRFKLGPDTHPFLGYRNLAGRTVLS